MKPCSLLLLALLIAGCQSVSPAQQAALSLAGTSWLAEDIDGDGVLDRVQSTITFESAERIAGSTGCNRYFAQAQISDETLQIKNAGSTRMACPPAVMDQEQRFLAALDATRTFRREQGTLWLLDENQVTRMRLTQTQ